MRSLGIIAVAVLALVSAACGQDQKRPFGVPPDAVPFRQSWFLVYPGQVSWDIAKERCQNLGGRLAIIPDRETQEFLARLANKRSLWLGATNLPNGEWKWLDGTKVSYTNWLKGQPSNYKNKEHWLVLGKDGGWYDIDRKSDIVGGYICEWASK